MGPSKFKNFNLFSWTHEIFKVSQYKRYIKFETFQGYQTGDVPFKRGHQNTNFLTTPAIDT